MAGLCSARALSMIEVISLTILSCQASSRQPDFPFLPCRRQAMAAMKGRSGLPAALTWRPLGLCGFKWRLCSRERQPAPSLRFSKLCQSAAPQKTLRVSARWRGGPSGDNKANASQQGRWAIDMGVGTGAHYHLTAWGAVMAAGVCRRLWPGT